MPTLKELKLEAGVKKIFGRSLMNKEELLKALGYPVEKKEALAVHKSHPSHHASKPSNVLRKYKKNKGSIMKAVHNLCTEFQKHRSFFEKSPRKSKNKLKKSSKKLIRFKSSPTRYNRLILESPSYKEDWERVPTGPTRVPTGSTRVPSPTRVPTLTNQMTTKPKRRINIQTEGIVKPLSSVPIVPLESGKPAIEKFFEQGITDIANKHAPMKRTFEDSVSALLENEQYSELLNLLNEWSNSQQITPANSDDILNAMTNILEDPEIYSSTQVQYTIPIIDMAKEAYKIITGKTYQD